MNKIMYGYYLNKYYNEYFRLNYKQKMFIILIS